MSKKRRGEFGAASSPKRPKARAPAPSSVASGLSVGPRPKLPTVTELSHVVELLRRSKRILVLSGAGISVSCGIPDFRSERGVYAMVEALDLRLPQPECLFDIEFFRDDPRPGDGRIAGSATLSPVTHATATRAWQAILCLREEIIPWRRVPAVTDAPLHPPAGDQEKAPPSLHPGPHPASRKKAA